MEVHCVGAWHDDRLGQKQQRLQIFPSGQGVGNWLRHHCRKVAQIGGQLGGWKAKQNKHLAKDLFQVVGEPQKVPKRVVPNGAGVFWLDTPRNCTEFLVRIPQYVQTEIAYLLGESGPAHNQAEKLHGIGPQIRWRRVQSSTTYWVLLRYVLEGRCPVQEQDQYAQRRAVSERGTENARQNHRRGGRNDHGGPREEIWQQVQNVWKYRQHPKQNTYRGNHTS